MNCPNCGKEMQLGYCHGGIPVIWSPKEVKYSNLKGKEEVYIRGSLSDRLIGYSTEPAPTAHICKDCRKVVIDY